MITMNRMVAAILIVSVLFICGGTCLADDVLNIVCTSFPCYDFVRAVAGDRAKVQMLIKPGAEVHSFEPTPADVMAIAGCDLFVYIGGESDAWAVDILESFGGAAPRTLRFFDCIEVLENKDDHGHDEHAHEYDEHIWTSPANACFMINALADVLCEIDAEHAEVYQNNETAYEMQIAQLSSEFAAIVEGSARREMIFADRFPFLYFAKEYDIEWYAAFPTCAAESEPSAKTIAELISKVNKDGIPVIYTLELSSGKTAKTIAEETGAKILTFHSIQNVTETDFSAGETYISLMQRNADALREGLN